MARGLLEDRAELELLFDELAVELEKVGATARVVMVGGAWMLWHANRMATRDVDSARNLDPDVKQVVAKMAPRHDLSPVWLNDSAAPFWPASASYEECELVYERGALEVRSPGSEIIFVMKLYRADPQDREDLVALWPRCDFLSVDEAADAFRLAYAHAPEDEHLADYIAEVARDATHG